MCVKKNVVSILLIISLLITPITLIMNKHDVAANTAANYSPFHDVATSYWGLPYIVKTEARGVIAGYGNGIFKPEQTVTQLEAIIMAVRAMGLEKETDNTNNYVDTSKYNLPTTWNAKGYVSVAIKHQLIRDDDRLGFKPDAGASRSWTAQLLIRMLKMDNELQQNAITTFDDDLYIPDWAKPSVALAAEKGVIAGIPNKNNGLDFKPNDAVKRVELATLIGKSDRYMNDVAGQLPLAIVAEINANTNTIEVIEVAGNGSNNKTDITKTTTIKLSQTSLLYNAGYAQIDADDLQVGDLLRFAINNKEEIKYAEQVNKNHYPNIDTSIVNDGANKDTDKNINLDGVIIQHFAKDKIITIRNDENKLLTYTYIGDVLIRDITGKQTLTIDDLQIGRNIKVTLTNDTITAINIQIQITTGQVQGILYALDLDANIVTVQVGQSFQSYQLDPNIRVEHDSLRLTLRDLKVGDEIQLSIIEQTVNTIKLLVPQSKITANASVVSLSVTDKILTIIADNISPQAYKIANNVAITVDGVTNPTLYDIQVGDRIEFTAEKNEITKINVINRSYTNEVLGEVVRLDPALRLVIIKDNKDQYLTYEIDRYAVLEIDVTNPIINDIPVGETVKLFLDKNIVQKVTLQNSFEGTIEGIDRNRGYMNIKVGLQSQSYRIASDVTVNMYDHNNPKLTEVEVGQTAIFELKQNAITRINVKKIQDTLITSIDTTNRRIDVEHGDSTKRYYLTNNNMIVIPNIAKPTFNDLRVGNRVTLSFEGYQVVKVEVLPPAYGTVTKVDKTNNRLELSVNGKTELITINSAVVLYNHASNRISISDFSNGDYIKILIINNSTVIYRAETLDVDFVGADTERGKVFYYDSISRFWDRTLFYEATFWQGTQSIKAKDIKADSKVTVYIIDNHVIGIRVK